MTWEQDEQSIQASQPIELYTIVSPTTTYRYASFAHDVTIGGNTYTATPLSRSNYSAVCVGTDQDDLTVELPASNAFVQSFCAGYPPYSVTLTLARYQQRSALAVQCATGYVNGCAFKDRTASLRVANWASDPLAIQISSVVVSRTCPHQLYGPRCSANGGPARSTFTTTTTITAISVDGKTVTVAQIAGSGPQGFPNWATYGDLIHVPTGESRSITLHTQAATTAAMSVPYAFPRGTISVGDSVKFSAGCAHILTGTIVSGGVGTCIDVFVNQLNFGGMPQLPLSNPFYVSITTPGGPAT